MKIKVKMNKSSPKQEGIYLYRYTKKEPIEIVYVDKCKNCDTGKGECWVSDYPNCHSSDIIKDGGYWYGPLSFY